MHIRGGLRQTSNFYEPCKYTDKLEVKSEISGIDSSYHRIKRNIRDITRGINGIAIFSPPNFSLEWAIAVVMRRRRRRRRRCRRRQHFRKSTSSNARVLKFCTDFLDGSEGRVRKFRAISSTWARIMGKKGFLRMRLSL